MKCRQALITQREIVSKIVEKLHHNEMPTGVDHTGIGVSKNSDGTASQ